MLALYLLTLSLASVNAGLLAGTARVDATLPIGTPLAGFNHGHRRVPMYPLPQLGKYTTWMMPSVGILSPTFVRALVIDDGITPFCFITWDAIGADGTLARLAWDIAVDNGFTVPWENVMFTGSHSHSGPGAISPEFLWQVAPAVDLMVPELQQMMANSVATAMVQAQKSKQPAKLAAGHDFLIGVTRNRRGGISPVCNYNTIDPNVAVLRVETLSGNPLAVVWNFAIHGICYGPDNMKFSSDIMGGANDILEQNLNAVSLFLQGDAGDIDPADGMCTPVGGSKTNFVGSGKMANKVLEIWGNLTADLSNDVELDAYSHNVNFGSTNLNYTLQRFNNCTSGGPLDICTICEVLRCDVNLHMGSSWIETNPKFTGLRISNPKARQNKETVVVTLPGEPLLELGWWVRNDTQKLGYDVTFLAGYSNSHMGYFATPNEYDVGGYESQLTFWGIGTAEKMRQGAYAAAQHVVASQKRSKSNKIPTSD